MQGRNEGAIGPEGGACTSSASAQLVETIARSAHRIRGNGIGVNQVDKR